MQLYQCVLDEMKHRGELEMKGARAVTSFVFYHTRLYVSNGPAVELNIVFLTESATYFGYVLVLLTCWLRLSRLLVLGICTCSAINFPGHMEHARYLLRR